jgi:hypothetical protein
MLSCKCGDSAADIAGAFLQVLHRDQLNLAITGGGGRGLEIPFLITRNGGHAEAMTVALGYQSLKELSRLQSDLGRNRLGREIFRVHFVLEQFVLNCDLIQEASGVRVPCQGVPILERIPADMNQFLGGAPGSRRPSRVREGKGVSPGIKVKLFSEHLAPGEDMQMLKALELLRSYRTGQLHLVQGFHCRSIISSASAAIASNLRNKNPRTESHFGAPPP